MARRGTYLRLCVRRLAEDCLRLDTKTLRSAGLLTGKHRGPRRLVWAADGEQIASAVVTPVLDHEGVPALKLQYTVVTDDGAVAVEQIIALTKTTLNAGGARWWLLCPSGPDGRPCDRRVGVLFLPFGEALFACRHCYALQYLSTRQCRKGRRTVPAVTEGEQPDSYAPGLAMML